MIKNTLLVLVLSFCLTMTACSSNKVEVELGKTTETSNQPQGIETPIPSELTQ